jgi:integrase
VSAQVVPTLRPVMGSMYGKRGRIWLRVQIQGAWRDRPTGLDDTPENRKIAREILRQREAMVAAAEEAGLPPQEPVTLADWWRVWAKRHEDDRSHVDDRGRWAHLAPLLGQIRLDDVRPRHVRAALRELRAKELAPRTVHHCYSVLRRMLREAQVDELVTGTPWTILPGDLPPKRDKDAGWREGALYTPAEIVRLATDRRITEDRRTLYALLGYAGLRFGEAAALRWSDYDAKTKPLGKLTIARAASRGVEKGTKTERPRMVPVHPSLAAALASWKLGGWARTYGRKPEPGDLVVPTRRGNLRPPQRALRYLHTDLERLGLEPRRLHDLRRSWITWARDSGAAADHVRWIAHGPSASVLDMYTSTPWAVLCAVVAGLRAPEAATA